LVNGLAIPEAKMSSEIGPELLGSPHEKAQ
jgi:hypothetical protein